jgi:hypothetical protein
MDDVVVLLPARQVRLFVSAFGLGQVEVDVAVADMAERYRPDAGQPLGNQSRCCRARWTTAKPRLLPESREKNLFAASKLQAIANNNNKIINLRLCTWLTSGTALREADLLLREGAGRAGQA